MSNEIPKTAMWFGWPSSEKKEEVGTLKAEALKILDRDTVSLGDLNPLIHATDLTRRESVDAMRLTTSDKIQKYGGLSPQVLESTLVYDAAKEKSEMRFIARFEISRLTEEQLVLLEDLVKETYGVTVRTRVDSKGNDMPTESYPPIQQGEEAKSKTGGWYMGPDMSPTTSLHTGLFIFKDLGQVNKKNFLKNIKASTKYIIEVREAGQYQTDLVTFISQVAVVLGRSELIKKGNLLYETYYDLIRLGLKKVDSRSIYGMGDALHTIRKELLTPLASPDLSRGITEDPESVLMVGVPGTGKTLLVEQLLNEETGIFILPISPLELHTELIKPKEKQTLIPRIAEVGRLTGKPVVLHVDDIENMVQGDNDIHSTILNLMAGVKECGFYIIASTNKPEKIDPALIEPQRFGVLIYCGLQNGQARYEILKIHANLRSIKLGLPLFASDEIRDIILKEIVERTEYFTPRYIRNIATVAKAFFVDRIAREKRKRIGLTEQDLIGFTYSVEDWEKALAEVSSKYDRESVRKRDEELRNFVIKHQKEKLGYGVHREQDKIFSGEILSKIENIEAELKHNNLRGTN